VRAQLGGPFLCRVTEDLREDGLFAAYSAHDYTILGILSSLKLRSMPEDLLEFAAYLLFELVETQGESGVPVRNVRIRLAPRPFPNARRRFPLDLVPTYTSVVDDLPYESFSHFTAKLPATWEIVEW
jgi:hypothetical protein